ncbi:MAG TPA: class C sortase [Pseudogracilibacillus sp.]|nr:class C sortase [Pseudogracilibacillus sp.]
MLRKIIIIFIFITGLIVFTYPVVTNWFNSEKHYRVMSKHNETLQQMSEEAIENERKKAEEHNNAIDETSIPITDPFSSTDEANEQTGYYDVLNIAETMGRIEIPSIRVNLPIYHGISDDVLQQGIGHMSNSSFPIGGKGTHTALTGHRGLPSSKLFRDLDKVKDGDVFFIHTLGETLAYEVDSVKIVLPDETNWLSIKEDKDYVTLITCEPYMINTHRLLVRGERIPYEKGAAVKEKVERESKEKNLNVLYIGICVTIVLFIVVIAYRKMNVKLST